MPPAYEYKPKLSVELPQQLFDDLKELLPPGFKSPVIRALLEQLVMVLKSHKHAVPQVLGLIISHEFNLARAVLRQAKGESNE